MSVLITGANSPLARVLITALADTHEIRATDTQIDPPIAGVETCCGDLREQAFVDALVDGVTELIHLAPLTTRLSDESATLDHATRGTYQLVKAVGERGVKRIILGSTLDLFAPLWQEYRVDEAWRPRPQPQIAPLCAYLAEVAVREVVRVTGTPALCLRLGEIVDDATIADQPYDPRWLHVNDAVSAFQKALSAEVTGWQIFHIAAGGDRAAVPVARAADAPLHYQPQHDFRARWDDTILPISAEQPAPIPPRPIRKVVVFGAGGPLGSAVAEILAPHYTLRLTDVKPVEELMQIKPQGPGAPLPVPPQPPHEWRVVDVRDAGSGNGGM